MVKACLADLLELWYILTTLGSLEETLSAYKARSGIEAMFKDCKSGGYNLEGSRASVERLTRLVLLIALSSTKAALQGLKINKLGEKNISIVYNKFRKNSKGTVNFGWVHTGFYG